MQTGFVEVVQLDQPAIRFLIVQYFDLGDMFVIGKNSGFSPPLFRASRDCGRLPP